MSARVGADLGFRSDVDILFSCDPAVLVVLDVQDQDGRPTMASFIFRDRMGRVYPSPSRRLAPDFFFHPQIYRHSGESVEHCRPELFRSSTPVGPSTRRKPGPSRSTQDAAPS